MNNRHPVTPSSAQGSPRHLVILITLAFLAIYTRTSAPSVLSGDSAEFQLAAATLGVAHPTTYPLYTLLGYLATILVPFGDLAWRVTFFTAGCAALAVGMFCALALRLGVSRRAALIGTIALGVTPGLWNAATVAEVYALLALLMVVLGYVVSHQPSAISREKLGVRRYSIGAVREPPVQVVAKQLIPQHREKTLIGSWFSVRSSAVLQFCSSRLSAIGYRLSAIGYALPAFIAGLGFTHHGLFAITALPPFAIWALLTIFPLRHLQVLRNPSATGPERRRGFFTGHFPLALAWERGAGEEGLALVLGFLAGCTPWLYPLVQFARYGPFQGIDYGLPRHYFWGAPMAWPEVFDLLTGGSVRRGIFRMPTSSDALATLGMLWERANFEFGAIGLVLALVGGVVLFRRLRGVWLVTIWVLIATTSYLLLLGPAVEDAPIFTLPMLLPLALWVAFGAQALIAGGERLFQRLFGATPRRVPALAASWLVFVLLLGASVAWADTRVEYASKRHLTLYRTFGEAVLAELPPNAVLIAHWEQGMVFQYLRLVEHQRPDVWVDVVEPSDDAWGPRIARRYRERPVFLIGQAPDVDGLPVELVREDAYALVFRLRK